MTRVLGVDPGSRNCGWAVLSEDGRLIDQGHITTTGTDPVSMLGDLHQQLEAVVTIYRPSSVAMESLFFHKNVSSAIAVGEARGVVILLAAQWRMPVYSYTPQRIKKAVTGSGKADKKDMKTALVALHPGLAAQKSDHALDAVGAAIVRLQELADDAAGS